VKSSASSAQNFVHPKENGLGSPMNRPSRQELLIALRAFAKGVLQTIRTGVTDGIPQEAIEVIENVGWKGAYVAQRLEITGHDYVPPDAAQQVLDLICSVNKVAETVPDREMATKIRRPADALNEFLSRYSPRQTESGKFIFRLDDE